MTPVEFEVFESYSLEFHIAQTASSQGLSTEETEALRKDIVVEPGRRKAGIGSDVIRLVEERARALGCTRLALHTNPANEALRLYRRLGFDIVGVDLQRTIAS